MNWGVDRPRLTCLHGHHEEPGRGCPMFREANEGIKETIAVLRNHQGPRPRFRRIRDGFNRNTIENDFCDRISYSMDTCLPSTMTD